MEFPRKIELGLVEDTTNDVSIFQGIFRKSLYGKDLRDYRQLGVTGEQSNDPVHATIFPSPHACFLGQVQLRTVVREGRP